MRNLFLVLALIAQASPAAADDARVVIFDGRDMRPWETKSFHGHTRYTPLEIDGRGALRADSRNSASGLYRLGRIDLKRTPYLHWSWRIERAPAGNDERTKGGDDYAARVYVVLSGGALFWKTRAINYVWSNAHPAETMWPNAYTARTRMVAVNTSDDARGEWIEIKRDVAADFRRVFGEAPDHVDAVAIMTDTDDTGQSATAYYGPIYFSTH